MIFFWASILILSLVILVKAAEHFVSSAEKVGLIFGISPFFIGVTIVAFGTSVPELFTSLFAVLSGAKEMVVGNIVGSNIANILLVIGLTAVMVKKIKIDHDILNLDLPLLATSTIGLVIMVAWDGVVNIFEGMIALLFYVIYFYYFYKSRHDSVPEEIKKEWTETKEKISPHKMTLSLLITLILSIFFLVLSAKLTILSAVKLSVLVGVATSTIALSAIAIGTSLPELVVTIKAAENGNGDMAIGNVFGSNLFNGSLILGLSTFFGDLPVENAVLYIAVPFLVIATTLYIFSGISKKVYNYEGAMFVLIYVLFLSKLFNIF